MTRRRILALGLWLTLVAVLATVVARASFTADMSVFLPADPTEEQRLLVDQLREGMVSRLILVGLSGGDAAARQQTSRHVAAALRGDARFAAVNNGEPVNLEADRRFLFDNRYALSPAVTPGHFTVEGLCAALGRTLDLLASPAGLLAKPLVTRDPTGEMMRLLDMLDRGEQPRRDGEVWVSADGGSALLLALTRAEGGDLDGQEAAMAAIREAFAAAPASAGLQLEMSGPGVFAVHSRDTIKRDVTRIATIGSLLIVGLLLLIYRSLPVLLLGLLPVLTGALAGIAAVSLGFGVVHGLTLGFGTTLIGEAVDYAIYLFVQTGHGQARDEAERRAFWPTIRLGLLTSTCGFLALLLSGFPGLAQLGLYSITGLLTAALVTRFILPALLPAGFALRDVTALGERLGQLAARARRLRALTLVLALGALAVIAARHDTLWNDELLALSPVPAADQALDQRLRDELGAPDVRYLIVIDAGTREAVLQAAEALAPTLDRLQADGVLGGWDSPAHYLPSQAAQRARLAALPARDELARRLQAATEDLPLRAERLTAFLDEVEAARKRPPVERDTLVGSSLALAVDAMLIDGDFGHRAMLPLRAPAGGASAHLIDADTVRAALATADLPAGAGTPRFLDTKRESDALYHSYLSEAIQLSLGGVAAIVVLLAVFLRSPLRVLRVVAPLAAAVLVVTAALALAGRQLILLHLVGMLLVVAVGSNYALFFDHATREGQRPAPRTLASLLFATLTTMAGFGLLAFAEVPVLQAIGVTVGPGALLALVFSAVLSRTGSARGAA
ncbi:MMPL family transporter [Thauera sp. CAU 1555]|uniref:MMPL family transporter n=1 Tax=Thauera sedimentorum TaxID=2767595 RepID=A0ABR9BD97_9RHOO|nr:MMPL family transporter [Thauera sedimentorum]MBC9073258.1 MMPL family transporter [Thauera sedimentorum]MBD8504177.1 MMPL family transporter [Thauera sedimentorum]